MIKLDNSQYNLFSSSFYRSGLDKDYQKNDIPPSGDNPDESKQIPPRLDEPIQIDPSEEYFTKTEDFEEANSSLQGEDKSDIVNDEGKDTEQNSQDGEGAKPFLTTGMF